MVEVGEVILGMGLLVVAGLLVDGSLLVWGMVGVGGGGDLPSICIGVGGCSKLRPQSNSITGYFSLVFLFFLLELVGGEVVLVWMVVVWSPPLFLDGDKTSPLSMLIAPLILCALLRFVLSFSHSLTVFSTLDWSPSSSSTIVGW